MEERIRLESANNASGYTLIEVLAAVALLAISCSLAFPALTLGSGAEVEQFAHNLAVEMRLTQQKAISSGRAWEVRFYSSWVEIWGPNSVRQKVYYVPTGLSWHPNYNPSGSRLGFDALGHPYPGGRTIGIKDQHGNVRYIIVAPVLGRIRVDSQPPSP